MITLHYGIRKKLVLPDCFEELTPAQYVRLAPLLFMGGDETACQVKALKILCGLGAIRFLLLPAEAVSNALSHIAWVFQPLQFTKQLLPCYKGWYGPESDFDNLLMKEFHHSEGAYRDIVSGDTEAINTLVAVLYRKPKSRYNKKRNTDGDIRRPFNHNELAFATRKVARWPEAIKQAIFLWYDSCRQQLIKANPRVFKDSGDGFKSEFDTGLYGTMRGLAGDKLGPIEKVENLYVHTAMLEIGLIREEQEYYEQKLKTPA